MEKVNYLLEHTETLFIFGIIVAATMVFAWIVGRFFNRALKKRTEFENIDVTSFAFIKHLVIATIYFFGFGWALLTLPISRNFAHSLFAGAGVSTLILGFASQQILGNMMSGIFLIVKRPFNIDDVIEIQGNRGRVIEIDLHATTLLDEHNNKITIPNSMISGGVIKNIKQN